MLIFIRTGIVCIIGFVMADSNPYFLRIKEKSNKATVAKENQFPFIVGIHTNVITTKINENRCGLGVIISEFIILTAASVLFDEYGNALLNPQSFLVQYGVTEFIAPTGYDNVRQVKYIVLNKKYSRNTFEGDLAIMILYKSIFGDTTADNSAGVVPKLVSDEEKSRATHSLGYNTIRTGAICRIFGFQKQLMYSIVELEERSLCDDAYRQQKILLPNDIYCAGVPSKDNVTTKSDVGGPLICETKVVAIVSYVQMPGKLPGIYTIIGKHKEFIDEAFEIAEIEMNRKRLSNFASCVKPYCLISLINLMISCSYV